MKRTSEDEIDKELVKLDQHRKEWAELSIETRISLTDQILRDFESCNSQWVEAAVHAKGTQNYPGGAGQEWLAGVTTTLRNLRLLGRVLRQIRDTGRPQLPGKVRSGANGQVIAEVFPTDGFDKLLFAGTTAEIWMQPEVTPENLADHMASHYREPGTRSAISLILGAGNVASIPPMDCFYKMIVEKKLVILKMHPVNAYLGPFFEKGLAALIDRGYLAIVYGGGDIGEYLCTHQSVDEIHITGSDKTHDLIVFGSAEQKAARQPRNERHITSELGNVSPLIVVPGEWSASDLAFQAESIVSSLANNAGFNCNATRVLICHKGWSQREALLEAIRKILRQLPPRPAYYPGASDRFDDFLQQNSHAECFGLRSGEDLPWMMIPNVDPDATSICFQKEAFCGLFCETAIAANSAADFLSKAVVFANEKLWGTLNAGLIVHPSTLKTSGFDIALEQAITDLRFGTVALNVWAAIGYALCTPSWGAYPGHEKHDIQSGYGVVHNTYMLEKTQKSVIRAPFRSSPKPAWFVTHRTTDGVGRKMAAFEAAPSVLKLPSLLFSALRG